MNCDLIRKKSCSIHFDDLSVDDNTLNYYCCERCVDLCTSILQSSFFRPVRLPLPPNKTFSLILLVLFCLQLIYSVANLEEKWTHILLVIFGGRRQQIWGPNIVCMFIVYIDRGNAIYFCTSMK